MAVGSYAYKLEVVHVLLFWFLSALSAQEMIPMANTETRIINGILYLYWNVTPRLENTSNVIHFRIKYCPVDESYDFQNCKVNVTICEANYTGSPFQGTTLTHEDNLSEYLNNEHLTENLIEKDKPALLSSSWNRTSKQFVCAVHNVKECLRDIGRKVGDFLITAAVNATKYQEIRLKKGRQLLKPENITIKQNEGVVTIKWESFYKCPKDVPDNYHISLRTRGNGSTTDWELSTFGKLYNSDWELNISDTLRPYSVYTVYIFGFIKRDEMKGPIAQKTFRTKEAAPSKPPSIECSICVKTSFFKDYRNVTVRWKLPPRDLRNGIIRSAVLIFWEEGHPDNASTLLIQHNLTFAIVPRLLQTSKYLFKVKICTLPHLCSGYSEVGHILEEYELTKSRTDQKSNSWITGLSIGLPVVVVVVVIVLVFCVLWRRKKRSYQETSDLMIQDYQLSETGFLGNTIEINKSDGALSVAFGEYHYLTPPVSEKSE